MGWVALTVGVAMGGGVGGGAVALLSAAAVIIVIGVWRWAFVPYVALTDQGVEVQNRLLRASVPYSDISEVRGGYYGLTIVTKRDEIVTAWAVQKSNWARWTKKQTRADAVRAAIMARVASPESR
jgi:ABC-type transport system involved in cytochrome bd biosynthesis fused ATPase/permease subunit